MQREHTQALSLARRRGGAHDRDPHQPGASPARPAAREREPARRRAHRQARGAAQRQGVQGGVPARGRRPAGGERLAGLPHPDRPSRRTPMRPATRRRRRRASSGPSTARSRARSAGAGAGCTRGSTSVSDPGRRSTPPPRAASSTQVGWPATATWSRSITGAGSRPPTATSRAIAVSVGQVVSQGQTIGYVRLHRPLLRPAPALRGADQRGAGRSARLPLSTVQSAGRASTATGEAPDARSVARLLTRIAPRSS